MFPCPRLVRHRASGSFYCVRNMTYEDYKLEFSSFICASQLIFHPSLTGSDWVIGEAVKIISQPVCTQYFY